MKPLTERQKWALPMASDDYKPHRIRVEIIKVTPKAFLVDYYGREFWIPKSQRLAGSIVRDEGEKGIMVIPRWLAKAKDIITE